jgi:hypothetical protein
MTPLTNVMTLAGSVVCVLAVFIALFVIPSMAPVVFLVACVGLLALAIWLHASEFGREEYRANTLLYTIKNSSSFIVGSLVVLGIVGFYYFNKYNQIQQPNYSSVSSVNSMNSMSPMTPMPPITAPTMIGGGFKSVAKNAISRIQHMLDTN